VALLLEIFSDAVVRLTMRPALERARLDDDVGHGGTLARYVASGNIPKVRPLSPEEEWARSVISQTLAVPVRQHDDGSEPAMYDFDILYPDRPAGAAEVTAAADPEAIEFWSAMNAGERWQEPTLAGGWAVTMPPSARARRLRELLPSFLSSLEVAGVRDFRVGESGNPRADQVARALGVATARQSDTDFPGSIYVLLELPPEKTGGWVADTGDACAEWLGDFLSGPGRADLRRKLGQSNAAETHAFVFLPGLSDAPFSVTDLLMRDDAPLPLADPVLPSEITHVWAASGWTTGRGFRWSRGDGWASFEKAVRPAS
jgi:hypothetical protein